MRNGKLGSMKVGKLGSVLICVLLLASGCASSPAAPTDPETVTLAPGATTTYGDLRLTFVRITGDSRCPGDAICITAGDAQAAIETNVSGFPRASEVHLFATDKRTIAHGDYTITFEGLAPYPFVSLGPIQPANYRATFKISRK